MNSFLNVSKLSGEDVMLVGDGGPLTSYLLTLEELEACMIVLKDLRSDDDN